VFDKLKEIESLGGEGIMLREPKLWVFFFFLRIKYFSEIFFKEVSRTSVAYVAESQGVFWPFFQITWMIAYVNRRSMMLKLLWLAMLMERGRIKVSQVLSSVKWSLEKWCFLISIFPNLTDGLIFCLIDI